MRLLFFVLISLTLGACTELSLSSEPAVDASKSYCLFSFDGIEDCHVTIDGKLLKVDLIMGDPEHDERSLEAVSIQTGDHKKELPLSRDVSIIEGDTGYVQFRDIDFDGHRDLAVTTSFGVANLYLDYWVYDADKSGFRYVGNLPDLTPVPEDQALTSKVKLDAESYDRQVWVWDEGNLVHKSPHSQRSQ